MTTGLVIAIVASLSLIPILVWLVILRLGLSGANVTGVSLGRTLLAAVALGLLGNSAGALSRLLLDQIAPPLAITSAQFMVILVASTLLVGKLLTTDIRKSLHVWLPILGSGAIVVAMVPFLTNLFVLETFLIPTNGMAPTLVGTHFKGSCPKCGETSYCSPNAFNSRSNQPPEMICDNFHVTQSMPMESSAYAGDRVATVKFIAPRRWDMVVFKYPDSPDVTFVKRLVGMPGETIHIEDGAVWINGVRQNPPTELEGIEYLSEIPGVPDMWGTADNPATLGDNEYFVLGDFSANSLDSRLWQRGAPGHLPYAVPHSHLTGVVTHTYWPLEHWMTHR